MEHLKKACALAETELAKRIASNNLALGCESGGAEIIVEALAVAYAAGVSEAEIQQANRILMRGDYHSHCLSVSLTLTLIYNCTNCHDAVLCTDSRAVLGSLHTHSHCSSFCSARVMELGSIYIPSSA